MKTLSRVAAAGDEIGRPDRSTSDACVVFEGFAPRLVSQGAGAKAIVYITLDFRRRELPVTGEGGRQQKLLITRIRKFIGNATRHRSHKVRVLTAISG